MNGHRPATAAGGYRFAQVSLDGSLYPLRGNAAGAAFAVFNPDGKLRRALAFNLSAFGVRESGETELAAALYALEYFPENAHGMLISDCSTVISTIDKMRRGSFVPGRYHPELERRLQRAVLMHPNIAVIRTRREEPHIKISHRLARAAARVDPDAMVRFQKMDEIPHVHFDGEVYKRAAPENLAA